MRLALHSFFMTLNKHQLKFKAYLLNTWKLKRKFSRNLHFMKETSRIQNCTIIQLQIVEVHYACDELLEPEGTMMQININIYWQ